MRVINSFSVLLYPNMQNTHCIALATYIIPEIPLVSTDYYRSLLCQLQNSKNTHSSLPVTKVWKYWWMAKATEFNKIKDY